ncbi:MAG TPA: HNH endonuclease signature motif containing protein [Candidatus Paceibacterota bacterium]
MIIEIPVPLTAAQQVIKEMHLLLHRRRVGKTSRDWFLASWGRLRRRLETTPEYHAWRQAVLATTCGWCSECNNTAVNCHHVVRIAMNPDRALDVSNGVPLCRECHAAKHPKDGE